MADQQPTIGRVVHYVSYGTPKGEYASKCVASIITQVNDAEGDSVGLFVMNPAGIFFNPDIKHDEGKAAGSWHWPERV